MRAINVEWDIPFQLTTPYGTFLFNQQEYATGLYFLLDKTKCSAFRGLRATTDPMPQASGSIVHREYADGYSMRLAGWIMETADIPACNADLRAGWDQLSLHVNALLGDVLDLDGDSARIQWTPTDYGQDRLLGDLRLLEELTPAFDGAITEFSFAVHAPFPYAVDQTQHTDALDITIDNPGNTVVFPNFKVYGATSGFGITNVTTGQAIIYDAAQPGGLPIDGGDYAFVSCFGNSIFLNGSGTNLLAGLDIESSEFFGLVPGENIIEVAGATADMIWNAGWA